MEAELIKLVFVALITGFLGAVVGALLSFLLQKKLQKEQHFRNRQFSLFEKMMWYRGRSITSVESKEAVDALNMIPIEFKNQPKVISKFEEYVKIPPTPTQENIIARSTKYIEVCVEIAKVLYADDAIDYASIDRGYFPKYLP